MSQTAHILVIVLLIKIETYWNVNEKEGKYDSRRKKIKIETYWNVNSFMA